LLDHGYYPKKKSKRRWSSSPRDHDENSVCAAAKLSKADSRKAWCLCLWQYVVIDVQLDGTMQELGRNFEDWNMREIVLKPLLLSV